MHTKNSVSVYMWFYIFLQLIVISLLDEKYYNLFQNQNHDITICLKIGSLFIPTVFLLEFIKAILYSIDKFWKYLVFIGAGLYYSITMNNLNGEIAIKNC